MQRKNEEKINVLKIVGCRIADIKLFGEKQQWSSIFFFSFGTIFGF